MSKKALILLQIIIFVISLSAIGKTYKFKRRPSWKEEFNNKGYPDSLKWRIDKDVNTSGRGTYYIKSVDNVQVYDGSLHLTITKDDSVIHSGRIQSKNIEVKYGRLDIRAKCPVASGVWPALYLRGTERSPYFGEIDILENWGANEKSFQMNYHVWGTFNSKKNNHKMHPKRADCNISEWHVYSFINLPGSSEIQVDGKTVYCITKDAEQLWPFDKASDIIFALAYEGKKGDDVVLPQTLLVDWVRYYKVKNL